MIREFVKQVRHEFGYEMQHDSRGFRKRMLRLLRSALPVTHGRPRLEAVSRAAEMQAQGNSWRAIYAVCIPEAITADSRQLAQSRLRSAVRSRRQRARTARSTSRVMTKRTLT
jgi:hypothetical protein